MAAISALEQQARAKVAKVADDPKGRLELRRAFYRKFGFGELLGLPLEFGYGTSELAFLQWEIDRGVLDPISLTGKGGSPWWRNVNLDFLYFSELAALAHERRVAASLLPAPTRAWLKYFAQPTSQNWYRAHNTSIVGGYLGHLPEALAESRTEQCFMNVVLYRVLYAQGLIEGVEMGRLGKLLANPELPSVDAMVHLPDFYPRHYPLTREDVHHVMHKGHSLEELAVIVLDDIFILPWLTSLYKYAAEWTGRPELCTYCVNGEPVYPTRIPHPWHEVIWQRAMIFLASLWQKLTRK